MIDNARLIMYHKHATSARTRFLRFGYGGVCGFDALPTLSSLIGEGDVQPEGNLVPHPAPLVADAERRLGLSSGELEACPEFRAIVDTPAGPCTVYLVRFTATDPPFEAAERVDGQFAAITEARGVPPVELELLRRAYAAIMED